MKWTDMLTSWLRSDQPNERLPLVQAPEIQAADDPAPKTFAPLKLLSTGVDKFCNNPGVKFVTYGMKGAGATYAVSDIIATVTQRLRGPAWFGVIGAVSIPYGITMAATQGHWSMRFMDYLIEWVEKTGTADQLGLYAGYDIQQQFADSIEMSSQQSNEDPSTPNSVVAVTAVCLAAATMAGLIITKIVKEARHQESLKIIEDHKQGKDQDRDVVIHHLKRDIESLKAITVIERLFKPLEFISSVAALTEISERAEWISPTTQTNTLLSTLPLIVLLNVFVELGKRYSKNETLIKAMDKVDYVQRGINEFVPGAAFPLDLLGMITIYILEHDVRKSSADDFPNALFGGFVAFSVLVGFIRTYNLLSKAEPDTSIQPLSDLLATLENADLENQSGSDVEPEQSDSWYENPGDDENKPLRSVVKQSVLPEEPALPVVQAGSASDSDLESMEVPPPPQSEAPDRPLSRPPSPAGAPLRVPTPFESAGSFDKTPLSSKDSPAKESGTTSTAEMIGKVGLFKSDSRSSSQSTATPEKTEADTAEISTTPKPRE